MGVGGQRHVSAALPPGKTRYPLYRRLGGSQGLVWRGANNLAPHRDSISGPFSPYTNWDIPAHYDDNDDDDDDDDDDDNNTIC